jgi:hypothetical protein
MNSHQVLNLSFKVIFKNTPSIPYFLMNLIHYFKRTLTMFICLIYIYKYLIFSQANDFSYKMNNYLDDNIYHFHFHNLFVKSNNLLKL